MSKAIVVFDSRTGKTAKYGEEIKRYLEANNIKVTLSGIKDFKNENWEEIDHIFLGCWTSGLFFFAQHPNKEWITFTRKLPNLKKKTVVLFTTYTIATGSMFKKMEKKLEGKISKVKMQLKSKTGYLTENDKEQLNDYLN